MAYWYCAKQFEHRMGGKDHTLGVAHGGQV